MNRYLAILLIALSLPGCSGGSSSGADWSNIDYARIARENQRRENDANYVQPSVRGCVDDDLYNCNPGGASAAKPW